MAIATFASCKACIACYVQACTIQAGFCIHLLCLSPYDLCVHHSACSQDLHDQKQTKSCCLTNFWQAKMCVCSMYLSDPSWSCCACSCWWSGLAKCCAIHSAKPDRCLPENVLFWHSESAEACRAHASIACITVAIMQCLVALFTAHDPYHPHQHKIREKHSLGMTSVAIQS